MPLYGRAFLGTKGPGEPFTDGVGDGSWERGVWDYKALPRPGAHEHVNDEVGASYSFDVASGVMVSYDTAEMAGRKVEFIRERGLGGAMWWESSADKVGEGESLIGNVVREMGGRRGAGMEERGNWLWYPESRFENLRKGFPGEGE